MLLAARYSMSPDMSILRVGINWHFDCASCPKMLCILCSAATCVQPHNCLIWKATSNLR